MRRAEVTRVESCPAVPAPLRLPSPHLGHLWLPRVLRPKASGSERMVSDETNVERRGVNQTDEPALRVTRRSLRSLLTCPEGGFAASFVASHPACGAEGKGVG